MIKNNSKILTKIVVLFTSFTLISLMGGAIALPALAQEAPSDTGVIVDTPADPAPVVVEPTTVLPDITAAETVPVDSTITESVPEITPTATVEELAPAAETPANAPELTTDKADYAPGETASIFGSFFQSAQNIILKIFGGEEVNNYTETTVEVTTNDQGSFVYNYILENVYRPIYNVIASTVSGEKLAETSFTDANKVGSVIVGTQSPNPVSAGNNATYTVTVSRGATGSFTADLSIITALPTGVSALFSPNPVVFEPTDSSKTTTLTLSTTSTTPVGSTGFTVKAERTAGDFATSSGTLAVSASTISDQTISVTTSAPATAIYGSTFGVAATANSGLPVAITTTGGCSGSGSSSATITMTSGVTTCVVHYNQAGNSSYNPAPEVTNNTTAQKANAIIVVTPYSVTYDGNPHTAVGSATGVESPTPADLTGLLNLSGTIHTNAGTYTSDAWTFTGNSNYNSNAGVITDNINKADAAIVVTGYSGVYDAAAHGATGTATGVEGEALTGLDLGATYTNVPGGVAHWVFTDVTGNYNDDSGDANVNIAKAPSTTTVTCPASVIYNGITQTPCTVSVAGVGGLSLTPTADYANNTDAGTATASYTFPGDTNHNGSSDTENFTIDKANPTITVTPYDVTYDGNPHTAAGSATGVLGESLSGLDISGTTHTNAGDYTGDAWIFIDTTGNYNDKSGTVDDNISKADQTLGFPKPADKIYGDPDFDLLSIRGGSDNPITFVVKSGPATVNGATVHITGAGTVIITASEAGNDNYNAAADVDQSFDVAKRAIAVTANTQSKIYGDVDPVLTYTFIPALVAGDSFSGVLSRVAGESIGSYAINQGTLTLGDNYTLTYAGANLTILPYGATTKLPPITIAKKDFQKSSTIPVKFTIYNGSTPVSWAKATLTVSSTASSAPAVSSGNSNIGNTFRYDTSGKLYIFNLSTKMPIFSSGNSYTLTIKLDDGEVITQVINIK